MTLKEKFNKVMIYPFSEYKEQMKILKEENSNEYEKIADKFAIGFAHFLAEHTYSCYESGWSNDFEKKELTTKELLEIYKKEKGL